METKFGIGEYAIKNMTTTWGSVSEGFSLELHKRGTLIANVEDWGDGSDPFVKFNREGELEDETYDFVVRDMQNLIDTLGDVAEEGAKHESFVSTPHSAVLGFTRLLLDFKGVVKASNTALTQVSKDSLYIVGSMGSSWFSNEDTNLGVVAFYLSADTMDREKANKKMWDFAERNRRNHGRLVSAAILYGEMDWELSLEDYSEFLRP